MKNSTNKWLGIATIILLLANIVTLTLLWTNKSKDVTAVPPPQGQVFQFVTEQLQLTQQQQDEYKKLGDEHQAMQRQIQDSIRNAKDAFFSLLQQPNVSEDLLQAAAKKCSEADEQMDLVTFKHFQKVRALCNADQQKKFDTIIKDVLHRMGAPRPQGPPPQGRGGNENGNMPPPQNGPPGGEGPPPQN